MKKKYDSPELEIEKFTSLESVMTVSDGQGGGDVEIEF